MIKLRNIIEENDRRFPEFRELVVIINACENESASPDTVLDCSKAIIEWAAKNILLYHERGMDERQIEGLPFGGAVKRALLQLANWSEDFEADFVDKLLKPITALSEIRNKRGDISHGHKAPKDNSSPGLAELFRAYAEAMTFYMLDTFFEIEYDLPNYGRNPDFNEFLDAIGSPIGSSTYSRLVYDNDFPSYQSQLDEYLAGQEGKL